MWQNNQDLGESGSAACFMAMAAEAAGGMTSGQNE
jgi:hypothetical protein